MFYNHWKKISLALTSFFWASCNNNSTIVDPPQSNVEESSSSEAVSSSSQAESSSSEFTQVMPAYGVPQMDCEVVAENDSTLTCANGYTCKIETILYMNPDYVDHPCLSQKNDNDSITQVCPDYGSIYYENKTYECDNGYTYQEYNLNKHYKETN